MSSNYPAPPSIPRRQPGGTIDGSIDGTDPGYPAGLILLECSLDGRGTGIRPLIDQDVLVDGISQGSSALNRAIAAMSSYR